MAFLFSSRRRHTRSKRDWSSDVCSSDLANLTIAMRQQDSGRTREWIEKTAGQTYITQATSYHGAGDGAYREARHAEVRPVSRVDWNDLTTLIEGEAIVLFGGRRIYARVFHAKIDDGGPKRLGRCMMLRAP